MLDLIFKNEIVRNKKQEQVKNGISSATGGIPKGLKGHKHPEKRIEKIHNT
jgi:hypothetical protein